MSELSALFYGGLAGIPIGIFISAAVIQFFESSVWAAFLNRIDDTRENVFDWMYRRLNEDGEWEESE